MTYQIEVDKKAFRDKQTYAENPIEVVHGELAKGISMSDANTQQLPLTQLVENRELSVEQSDQSSMKTELVNRKQPDTLVASERLKFWWSQADTRSRQEFMSWVFANQH